MNYQRAEETGAQIQIRPKHSTTKEPRECRICLQNEKQSDGQIRSVCSCEGSVKYVHLDCIREWIICSIKTKKQSEVNELKNQGIKCQLCKIPIHFQLETELVCQEREKVLHMMKKSKIFMVVFWILTLGLFAMIGYCVWQIKDYKQIVMDEVFVIYLTALITTSILILLALMFFVFRFCFKGAFRIDQIYKIVKGKKRRVSKKTDRLSYRRHSSSIRVENIQ